MQILTGEDVDSFQLAKCVDGAGTAAAACANPILTALANRGG
jgi:hypothetical protein